MSIFEPEFNSEIELICPRAPMLKPIAFSRRESSRTLEKDLDLSEESDNEKSSAKRSPNRMERRKMSMMSFLKNKKLIN
jgi:heme oxygenase